MSTQRACLADDEQMAFSNACWQALPPTVRDLATPGLLTRLDDAWQQALAAWPLLTLEPARLGQFIGERIANVADCERLLSAPLVGEMALACACHDGDDSAIALFEERYFPQVAASVARMRLSPHAVDEILQGLRAQLFVPNRDGELGIGGFRGKGALVGWLSVSAVRAACKLLKADKKHAGDGDEALARLSGSARDLEGQYTREWSQAAFKRAFVAALAELNDREKSLLRLHYLDGVTIDQLGAIYRTHRATAARWLASAKQRLLDRTRASLTEQLRIPLADCDSIIQAAQSRMELTFHRLFTTATT